MDNDEGYSIKNSSIKSDNNTVTLAAKDNEIIVMVGDDTDHSSITAASGITFNSGVKLTNYKQVSTTGGDVKFSGNSSLDNTNVSSQNGDAVFEKDANLANNADVKAQSVRFNGNAVLNNGSIVTAEGKDVASGSIIFAEGSNNVAVIDNAKLFSQNGGIDIASQATLSNAIIQAPDDIVLSKLAKVSNSSINSTNGSVTLKANAQDAITFEGDAQDSSKVLAAKDITFNSDANLTNTKVESSNGNVSFDKNALLSNSNVSATNGTVQYKGSASLASSTTSAISDVIFNEAHLSDSTVNAGSNVKFDGNLTATGSLIKSNGDALFNKEVKLGASPLGNSSVFAKNITFNDNAVLQENSLISATDDVVFNEGTNAEITVDNATVNADNGKIDIKSKATLKNATVTAKSDINLSDANLEKTKVVSSSGNVNFDKNAVLSNSNVSSVNGSVQYKGIATFDKTTSSAASDVIFNDVATLKESNVSAGNSITFDNALVAIGNNSSPSEIASNHTITFNGDSDLTGYTIYTKEESDADIIFNSFFDLKNTLLAPNMGKGKVVLKGNDAENKLTTVSLFAKELELGDENTTLQNTISLVDTSVVAPKVGIYRNTSIEGGSKLVASDGIKFSSSNTNNALTIFKGGKLVVGNTDESIVETNADIDGLDPNSSAMMHLDSTLDLSNPNTRLYLNGDIGSYSELSANAVALNDLNNNQLYVGPHSRLLITQGAIDPASEGKAIFTLANANSVYINDGLGIDFKFDQIDESTKFKLFNCDIDAVYKERIAENTVARIYDLIADTASDNSLWFKVKVDEEAVNRLASGISPDTKNLIVSYAYGDGFNIAPQNGYGYISELLLDDDKFSDAAVTAGINSFTGYSFASYAPQIAIAADESLYDAVAERGGFKSQAKTSLGSVEGENISLWATPLFKRQSSDSFKLEGSLYGAKLKLSGLAIGADTALDEHNRLGMAISFGKGNARSRGEILNTINDYSFYGIDGYGMYKDGPFSVLYDASFTHISNDVSQDTFRGSLDADFDAKVLSLGANIKYLQSFEYLDMEPHIGVRASHVDIDGFDAKINNIDYLKSNSSSANFIKFPLGVTLSKNFEFDGWQIKPVFDTAVVFSVGDKSWNLCSDITGMGRESTSADVLDTVTIQGTLGVDVKYNEALSFGVGYTFSGSHDVKEHALSGSIRYNF